MHRWLLIVVALVGLMLADCGSEETPPAAPDAEQAAAPPEAVEKETPDAEPPGPFVSVKDGRFVDPQGRHLLLHGINLGSKNKAENYLSWHGPEEFAAMRQWGFNCVRLLIIWDGVEPEPGKYDDEYLQGVDQRIQWAKENGLYVLVDMHQDLFSVKYGDGAPEWATLDEGKPHINAGTVWSDAYMTSQAVQTAFDNFWANAPAPDGVGIQDHFAKAWRHVAKRYADEPAIVGYDILNEPFMGSRVAMTQLAMLEGVAKGFTAKYGENAPDVGTVAAQWMTAEGRSELMKELGDLEVLKPAIEAATPISQEFDRTLLMPMYQRVAAAIREVDGNHLLFMEPNMFSNAGLMPALSLILGADGAPDPRQALAPHAYDMVTDTKDVSLASDARVAFIFDRLAEHGRSMGLPSLVGEWGAYYGQEGTLGVAQFVVKQFEKHLLSDTYWDFHKGVERAPYFPALARPYPVAVAGTLVRYESNHDDRSFTCTWAEDPSVKAPTLIYVPGAWYPDLEPRIDAKPACEVSMVPIEGTQSRLVQVEPGRRAIERTLTVSRRGFVHDSAGRRLESGKAVHLEPNP